jgi:hypothetical protein
MWEALQEHYSRITTESEAQRRAEQAAPEDLVL